MKECVVVLGMHRSGTSVLTGLVSLFGGYVGSELMKPTKDNPKGYFENNRIYVLNEKILRENNASWDNYSFVVEELEKEQFSRYVSEAKEIINDELKYVKRTIIKDPRICILFPIWEQALKELEITIKIIFSYRSPLEVAHSLLKRDQIAVEKGLMLWSHYFLQSEFYSRKYTRLVVQYDDDFQDLPRLLNQLGETIGVEVTDQILDRANELYSPSLKHHQVDLENISNELPSYLEDLIALLGKKTLKAPKSFDKIKNEYNFSKKYYFYNQDQIDSEMAALREQILTLEDQQKQTVEQQKVAEKHLALSTKALEIKTAELVAKTEAFQKESRTLGKREKDLSEARDDINTKNKRQELLESRLVVGDDIFNELVSSQKAHKILRHQTSHLFSYKLKQFFFPLIKGSSKRLYRDKSIIIESGFFSPFYYLSRYPDVWQAGVDPLEHFCKSGWKEGRNPNNYFNTTGYLALYPDVSRSQINPLVHYILHGKDEGRALPKSSYQLLNKTPIEKIKKSVSNDKAHTKEILGEKPFDEKKQTILLVAHSAGDVLYGGERSFFDMVRAASKQHYNIVVILPREQPEIIQQLKKFSSTILIFKYGWWKKDQVVDNGVIDTFVNVINKYQVSLVHVNTIMLREPLLAAKKSNVPSTIHIRELITGDETLAVLIGKDVNEITSIVNKSSDYIIANSHETANAYAADDKTTIIHNTVDVDLFDIENPIEDILRVGLISSNIEKKGVFEFLQIAEKCKDIENLQFVLIGPETNEVKEILTQVEQKGINNLIFSGYKNTSLEAIAETNIILNISKFTESFGRTVLEGMAGRRPVIGYKWGALRELIVDDQTGYLVPYLDIDLIVEKLKFLNENRTVVAEMGEAGRVRAISEFSFSAYTEKVADFYSKVLNSAKVINLHAQESKKQKIAYFLWHFPVPSETFVLNELRVLVENNYDVIVFCKQSPFPDFTPDFEISWERVATPKELAKKLKKTQRTIVHSHFTYPTVTNMVWPACEIAKVDFTFIAHAQDIFRYENIKVNLIGEISRSKQCRNVFIPSRYHRDYVIKQGVLPEKTLINPNGIDPNLYAQNRETTDVCNFKYSVCAIHRYTEKKGLDNLILSSPLIAVANVDVEIHIYGYGELEEEYRTLIKDNNLTNVHIHGAVDGREKMLEVFSRNDAFLCPSVRAENGDMDGIPTVLMEAMAYGIPVISTDISGIPDLLTHKLTGFITDPSPQGVADTINEFYQMPSQQLASISKAAKDVIYKNYNSISLVNNLVRAWSDSKSLDVIIVSWNNLPELKEVIRRIQKYTLTDYNLLICDNNSEDDVKEFLAELQENSANVTVYFNPDNSMVGPGSNIAIEMGSAEYIIYVCGREGFVFDYLWEMPFISHMDENPDVGLGGTLCYSPTYLTGDQYPSGVQLFDQFRNKQFATDNPKRIFKHIQGGLFVIRRQMYEQMGGFSDAVKHNYTDVEYSYYAESCGWKLGNIQGILSLYNKSRPNIFSRIDESIRAIHPPTLEQLPLLDQVNQGAISFCNICEWQGESFKVDGFCPSCNSLPDDRTFYRYLAESTLTYQRLAAISIDLPSPLQKFWIGQFQGESLSLKSFHKSMKKKAKLSFSQAGMQLFYYRNTESLVDESVLREASRLLAESGFLLIQQAESNNKQLSLTLVIAALLKHEFEFIEEISYSSAVVQYGWNRLWVFKKVRAK